MLVQIKPVVKETAVHIKNRPWLATLSIPFTHCEQWLAPHFEKMLYDQALIAQACLETYQITKDGFYARIADEIFTYVLRDMKSPLRGFYSAEDADSEGEEGKFYLWSKEEKSRAVLHGIRCRQQFRIRKTLDSL